MENQPSQSFMQEIEAATEQMIAVHRREASTEKAAVETTRSLTPSVETATVEVEHLVKLSAEHISEMLNIPIELILSGEDTSQGVLGFLNGISRFLRDRKFEKKVKRNPRSVRVVSEGDSWFQYPIFIKDIIDWLNRDEVLAIQSLGAGGDWIYNILTQREYIKALQKADNPEFFLISGGGNDLLENGRIANLVLPHSRQREANPATYIKQDFYDLIKLLKFLYAHLYMELDSLFPQLSIISHGYDYPFPSDKIGLQPIKALLRIITGNGQWITRPLSNMGIKEVATQRQIIKIMIDAYNEMHQKLSLDFKNVYYLDLRGIADDESDWHDEIHPNAQHFKRMSRKFEAKIKSLTDWEL